MKVRLITKSERVSIQGRATIGDETDAYPYFKGVAEIASEYATSTGFQCSANIGISKKLTTYFYGTGNLIDITPANVTIKNVTDTDATISWNLTNPPTQPLLLEVEIASSNSYTNYTFPATGLVVSSWVPQIIQDHSFESSGYDVWTSFYTVGSSPSYNFSGTYTTDGDYSAYFRLQGVGITATSWYAGLQQTLTGIKADTTYTIWFDAMMRGPNLVLTNKIAVGMFNNSGTTTMWTQYWSIDSVIVTEEFVTLSAGGVSESSISDPMVKIWMTGTNNGGPLSILYIDNFRMDPGVSSVLHYNTLFDQENALKETTLSGLTPSTCYEYMIRTRWLGTDGLQIRPASDWISATWETDSGPAADTVAPATPANLTMTSEVYYDQLGNYRSVLTCGWDKVTQNEDTTPISDLEGYEIIIYEIDKLNQLKHGGYSPGTYSGETLDSAMSTVIGRRIAAYTSNGSGNSLTLTGYDPADNAIAETLTLTYPIYSISTGAFKSVTEFGFTTASVCDLTITEAKEFDVSKVGATTDDATRQYYIANSARPGYQYAVKVRAYDVNGNYSGWTNIVNHTAQSDTEAPATPTGLAASATYKDINLRWNANTEEDLAGYEISRDINGSGTYTVIATITANFFVDSDVNSSDSYRYKLRAYDKAGNYSDYAGPTASVSLIKILDTDVDIDAINILTTINLLKNSSFEMAEIVGSAPWNWANISTTTDSTAVCTAPSGSVAPPHGARALFLGLEAGLGGTFYAAVEQTLTAKSNSVVTYVAPSQDYTIHFKVKKRVSTPDTDWVTIGLYNSAGTVTQFSQSWAASSISDTEFSYLSFTGTSASSQTVPSVKILYGSTTGGDYATYGVEIDTIQMQSGTEATSWIPYSDEFIYGDYLIDGTQITDEAIITPKIAANAILAKHIRARAIGANHLVVQNRHWQVAGQFFADRQLIYIDFPDTPGEIVYNAGYLSYYGGWKDSASTTISVTAYPTDTTIEVTSSSGFSVGDKILVGYLDPTLDTYLDVYGNAPNPPELFIVDSVGVGSIEISGSIGNTMEVGTVVKAFKNMEFLIAESTGVVPTTEEWPGGYRSLTVTSGELGISMPGPGPKSLLQYIGMTICDDNSTGTLFKSTDYAADFTEADILIGTIETYNQVYYPGRRSNLRLISGTGTTIHGSHIDTGTISVRALSADSVDATKVQAGAIYSKHLTVAGLVPNDNAITSIHFDITPEPSGNKHNGLVFDESRSQGWNIIWNQNDGKYDGFLDLNKSKPNSMMSLSTCIMDSDVWTTEISSGSGYTYSTYTYLTHEITTPDGNEINYRQVGRLVIDNTATASAILKTPKFALASPSSGNWHTASLFINTPHIGDDIEFRVAWYGTSGTVFISYSSADLPVTNAGWQRLDFAAQAPSTADYAELTLHFNYLTNHPGGDASSVHYVAHPMFTETNGKTSLAHMSQPFNFNGDFGSDKSPVLYYTNAKNTLQPRDGSVAFWMYHKINDSNTEQARVFELGETNYGSLTPASDKATLFFYKDASPTGWVATFKIGTSSYNIQLDEDAISQEWHHVVFTWKFGGNFQMYLDGILVGEATIGAVSNSNITWYSDDFKISHNNSTEFFIGYMDDLLLYDYQIDQNEVDTVYKSNGPTVHRTTSITGDSVRTGKLFSNNYVPNVSGWTVGINGNVEFNVGTFRGDVLIGGNATISGDAIIYGDAITQGAMRSGDYVASTTGWMLSTTGPAEFNNGVIINSGASIHGGAVVDGTLAISSLSTLPQGNQNLIINGSFEYIDDSLGYSTAAQWTLSGSSSTHTVIYDSYADVSTTPTIPDYGINVAQLSNTAAAPAAGLTPGIINIPQTYTSEWTSITFSMSVWIPSSYSGTPQFKLFVYEQGSASFANVTESIPTTTTDAWVSFSYSINLEDTETTYSKKVRRLQPIIRNTSSDPIVVDSLAMYRTNAPDGDTSLDYVRPYVDFMSTTIDGRGITAGSINVNRLTIAPSAPKFDTAAVIALHSHLHPTETANGALALASTSYGMLDKTFGKFGSSVWLGKSHGNLIDDNDIGCNSTSTWTLSGSHSVLKNRRDVIHEIKTSDASNTRDTGMNRSLKILCEGTIGTATLTSTYYYLTDATRRHVFSVYASAPEPDGVQIFIDWYDVSNSLLGSSGGGDGYVYDNTYTGWQRASCSSEPPVSTVKAKLRITFTNTNFDYQDVYFAHPMLSIYDGKSGQIAPPFQYSSSIHTHHLEYENLNNTISTNEGEVVFWARAGFVNWNGTGTYDIIDIGNANNGTYANTVSLGWTIKNNVGGTFIADNCLTMYIDTSPYAIRYNANLMANNEWGLYGLSWSSNDKMRLRWKTPSTEGYTETAIGDTSSKYWFDNALMFGRNGNTFGAFRVSDVSIHKAPLTKEEFDLLYDGARPEQNRGTSIDGDAVRTGSVKSNNYVSGQSGWAISTEGDVEFNVGTFRGDVIIGGGATISGDAVVSGDAIFGGSITSSDYIASTSGFSIGMDGNVEFSAGTFRGNVVIGSGVTISGNIDAANGVITAGRYKGVDGISEIDLDDSGSAYGDQKPWIKLTKTGGYQTTIWNHYAMYRDYGKIVYTSYAGASTTKTNNWAFVRFYWETPALWDAYTNAGTGTVRSLQTVDKIININDSTNQMRQIEGPVIFYLKSEADSGGMRQIGQHTLTGTYPNLTYGAVQVCGAGYGTSEIYQSGGINYLRLHCKFWYDSTETGASGSTLFPNTSSSVTSRLYAVIPFELAV